MLAALPDPRAFGIDPNAYGLGQGFTGWLLGVILACIALLIYFLPTLISLARRTAHSLGIFLINLFLGWSVIFWVLTLLWALIDRHVVEAVGDMRARAVRPT
jgi:hypothetical protein